NDGINPRCPAGVPLNAHLHVPVHKERGVAYGECSPFIAPGVGEVILSIGEAYGILLSGKRVVNLEVSIGDNNSVPLGIRPVHLMDETVVVLGCPLSKGIDMIGGGPPAQASAT